LTGSVEAVLVGPETTDPPTDVDSPVIPADVHAGLPLDFRDHRPNRFTQFGVPIVHPTRPLVAERQAQQPPHAGTALKIDTTHSRGRSAEAAGSARLPPLGKPGNLQATTNPSIPNTQSIPPRRIRILNRLSSTPRTVKVHPGIRMNNPIPTHTQRLHRSQTI